MFIVGTDTDVGKTYVASIIARQLHAAGHRVGVYKPVASGCREEGGQLVSDDAVALWNAAGQPGTLDEVCPQRFRAPLAPNVAARVEGKGVDNARLRAGLEVWRKRSEVMVVEGAGGWFSPLSDRTLVSDLAEEFGYPVVIVARNALGSINHTLLTIAAIRASSKLAIAAVVLNRASEATDGSETTNREELANRTDVPIVELAWRGDLHLEKVIGNLR